MSWRVCAWPAGLTLFLFGSFGWLIFFDGAGLAGEPAVLVFPPKWQEADVFAASASLNVPILGLGPAPFVAVVLLVGPETKLQAYDAGAIMILNSAAAALCGVSPSSRKP
jgi:hypothetical protein